MHMSPGGAVDWDRIPNAGFGLYLVSRGLTGTSRFDHWLVEPGREKMGPLAKTLPHLIYLGVAEDCVGKK